MRRIVLITLPAVVIMLLFIFIFTTRLPFGKNNSDFSSHPKQGITRIELSEAGKELTLEKSGDEWLINGKTKARKSAINFIITVLTDLKIKSPVAPELFESEITGKNIVPVSVKVCENRRVLKSFSVYKTGSNVYGNIMKIRESSKPFIMHVPGYEVNIGAGFTLNELFWQPYTIFNLLPSEISSIGFENLQDTSSSFSILKNKNGYSLSGTKSELTGWDTSKVVRYLSYFTWVPFESWSFETDGDEINIIGERQPLYRITVSSSVNDTKILTLWERKKIENGLETIDSDRLIGKTESNEELFIVRYFDIDPVLKKRSYFFNLRK